MKVIYKAPGCAPEPRDIPNTLEELQATPEQLKID